MTDVSGRDDSRGDETEYDPFEYVPDRIDQITASGLEQLHDALADRNKARLRSVPVEQQAGILWSLVEKEVIDVDVTRSNRGGESQ
jgi:hypothetical protein